MNQAHPTDILRFLESQHMLWLPRARLCSTVDYQALNHVATGIFALLSSAFPGLEADHGKRRCLE